MIEIPKGCKVAFMKVRNSLVVQRREKRVIWEKSRNSESIFLKLLLIDFG